MTYILQYTFSAFLGILGILIIICAQLKINKTCNNYNKIMAAMNANTSKGKSCTPGGIHKCNSVVPATWKNNIDIAKMFYTKNERKGSANPAQGKKHGGKWNINSGPSHPWGPAPINIYPPDLPAAGSWENQVAIVESANNLGNALGTLTARKKDYQIVFLVGIILVIFSFLFAIVGIIGTKGIKRIKQH